MMIKQNHQHLLLFALSIVIIAAAMWWMRASYKRMQNECDAIGGQFYSISFTQNICIDGTVVHELH